MVHLHLVSARRCIFLFLSPLSRSPQAAHDDGLRLVPQAAGLPRREWRFEQGALDLSICHGGQGVSRQHPGVEQLFHQVLQYGVGTQVGGGAVEAGLGHDELDQQLGRLDVCVQVGGPVAQVQPGQQLRGRQRQDAAHLGAAHPGVEVVGVQDVVAVAQHVGRLAADAGQDRPRVELVLGQDAGDGGGEDVLRRPAMVIHAVQRLQGMAEGRVAHVMQQRRGAKKVVLGAEVCHQRENAQRVL